MASSGMGSIHHHPYVIMVIVRVWRERRFKRMAWGFTLRLRRGVSALAASGGSDRTHEPAALLGQGTIVPFGLYCTY